MYLRFSGFFWVPLGPRKFPARPTGFMCMSVDSSPVQVLASFSTFLQTPPGSYGIFRKDPFGFYFLLLLRKSSSFLRTCFDTPGVSSRFPSHSLGFAQNLVGYLGPSGFFLPLVIHARLRHYDNACPKDHTWAAAAAHHTVLSNGLGHMFPPRFETLSMRIA